MLVMSFVSTMLLRSGTVYDPVFPSYMKEFCHFENPIFRRVWNEAAELYNDHLCSDELFHLFNPKRHKEARKIFQNHIQESVKKIYITHKKWDQ